MEYSLCTLLLISFTSALLISPQALGHFEFPDLIPDFSGGNFGVLDEVPSPASAPAPSLSAPEPSASAPAQEAKGENAGGVRMPVVSAVLKKICDATENPALCSETILSHVPGGQVDPVLALKTEIQAALNVTAKATEEIKGLLDQASQSHAMTECLQVCAENYDLAQDSLMKATEAVDSHDLDMLNSYLSSVIDDIGTCDDTFAEFPGVEFPLKDKLVSTVHQLADNCLDISTLLA